LWLWPTSFHMNIEEADVAEAHVGAALSSVVSAGVLKGLERLVRGELIGLAGSFDHVTLAGRVILGRVVIEALPPASFLFGPAYAALTAALAAVSLAHLVYTHARESLSTE